MAIRYTRRAGGQLCRSSAWDWLIIVKNATSAVPMPRKLWLTSMMIAELSRLGSW